MIEEDVLDQDAVFCVGRVVSVDGRRVRVAVDKLKNGSHLLYRGGLVRNVAVASYVKIVKGLFPVEGVAGCRAGAGSVGASVPG
ncbi:hypothetical protein [Miniimonas sp. S16]|uniref:hypothetical protein n=1 Tax=Miniimonas sp. S16 TaxID=2171623 RepID=UPI000D527F8C|nr:hypothetical protein [Miniimonas sp. S16]